MSYLLSREFDKQMRTIYKLLMGNVANDGDRNFALRGNVIEKWATNA